MNILPIIQKFLQDHSLMTVDDLFEIKRSDLEFWVRCGYALAIDEEWLNLAVNSLIAAGIGREVERTATVYCGLLSDWFSLR